MTIINLYGKCTLVEMHTAYREWEYYVEVDDCYCVLGASRKSMVYAFGVEEQMSLEQLQNLYNNGYFENIKRSVSL